FHDISADAASTALAMMAFILSGRPLYLSLLKMISKVSDDWWKLCSMHTLDTSGKPSRRSDEALLNSAPSSRPRSSAGTISPPGRALTAAPMAVNKSMARPLVRNFRPFRSSVLVMGFLNQPNAWVGRGPLRKVTTLPPISAYSSSSISLPPPYLCQDRTMLASMPKAGPDEYRARAFCLP